MVHYEVYYDYCDDSGKHHNECVLETDNKAKAVAKSYAQQPLYVMYSYIDMYIDNVYQRSFRPHEIENMWNEMSSDC